MSNTQLTANDKKPNPVIGVGLRHSHYPNLLQGDKQNVDFVEVHAENFFAKGGASRAVLQDVIERYPLSLHGTSLGLGSTSAVPQDVLSQFAELVQLTNPMLVSEHLCFNRASISSTGKSAQVVHSGDLLPIPYNQASLDNIVSHIQQVQDRIGREVLIENLSAYIKPSQLVADARDSMTEFEFLVEMCGKAGCGLLLDLNNLIINELNLVNSTSSTNNAASTSSFSLDNIKEQLTLLPPHLVGEIHLAGYTSSKQQAFIIDDHGAPVSSQCWDLYECALQHFDDTPTLVEWDTQIPEWSVLLAEANKARHIAEQR